MRAPGSDAGRIQDPQPPAELPDHIRHGGASAYNRYRCRCDECQEWRRAYDRRMYRSNILKGVRR